MARKSGKAESDQFPTPSVYAYSRSLDTTYATLLSMTPRGKQPIPLSRDTVRGVVADAKSVSGNNDKNVNAPNIQTVDTARVAHDATALSIQFGLKVSGNSRTPASCNEHAYEALMGQVLAKYAELGGYEQLAQEYLTALFSGYFVWRNWDGEGVVSVKGPTPDLCVEAIDAAQVRAKGYDAIKSIPSVQSLRQAFAAALKGEGVLRLEIEATLPKSGGEEVFPSQEFYDKEGKKEGALSKKLYEIPLPNGGKTAAFHSQKIGNALRTIDTWYVEDAEFPLPVEPTGYFSRQQRAIRVENKNDLYSLLKKPEALWENICEQSRNDIDPSFHFLVACLIRGGVFGLKDE